MVYRGSRWLPLPGCRVRREPRVHAVEGVHWRPDAREGARHDGGLERRLDLRRRQGGVQTGTAHCNAIASYARTHPVNVRALLARAFILTYHRAVVIVSCELCSRVPSSLSRGLCSPQVGNRVDLIANEDISSGQLKLAPFVERPWIDKAAPEITDGRPLVKMADSGLIELVSLSTTFEHKATRWAPTLKAKRQIEAAKDGKYPAGVPFWFSVSTPQGGTTARSS